MIHIEVQNPRNALQIVNAFAQVWWLAKKRETEELGTNRPGGLYEGSVTNHPLALGALCALRVNYPDFYTDLLEQPELIQRFTDVVIRRKPLKDLPKSTQELLSERYLQKPDNDSQSTIEVKPDYRSLRQFLSSLVGLRWPDSLQSLLLLSEDPITRKFGSNAPRIYEAFVSGDTQGVLDGLGRATEADLLRVEEARLLYQMAEELHRESSARRVNASRVIADLVERLPKETAHLLVGSLCRELGDSPDLRCQLGIAKIRRLFSVAEPADRRAIASRLIEDVLPLDRDMSFRLETMEPPGLDEAISFARETVHLALSVREEYALDTVADAQLLTWLVSRTVRVAGKEYQIPFTELEQWMAQHEKHLLPGLRERYTDLLASELESQQPVDFDISAAVCRAQKVFTLLWDSGEDTRAILWKDLTRYVALQHPDAAKSSWENMIRRTTSPSSEVISLFVRNFVTRLQKEFNDPGWELEFDSAAAAFLSIVRGRVNDLTEEAYAALADLAIAWSTKEETAALSSDLLNELRRSESNQAGRVVDEWISRVLNNLPLPCVKLVGSLVASLPSASQTSLTNQLRKVINTDNIDEATADRYKTFIQAVTSEAWQKDPLKSHLDQLLPRIAERHNNPNNYLDRVFPAVSGVLNYASPGPCGQMLQTLFDQAKGQPRHYAFLHSCMVGKWPKPSAQLNPYNPNQIFQDAQQFAVNHPASSSNGLLQSLRDLIERELIPVDQRPKVILAACATWSAEPANAIDTIKAGFVELTPAQTANLLDSINWSKENHSGLLTEAWTLITAAAQDDVARLKTTNLILDKGPKGPEDEPDRGLRIWIDAQGERRGEMLSESITQLDLKDPHRKRVWQQAVRGQDGLRPEFFIDIVPNSAHASIYH
jgi:hypothetical protein